MARAELLAEHGVPRLPPHRPPADLRSQHSRRAGDPLADLARQGGERPARSASVSRSVLEWAVAIDLRNDNPCDPVVLVLGPQNDIVTHRQALPHKDVAAAIETVRAPSSRSTAATCRAGFPGRGGPRADADRAAQGGAVSLPDWRGILGTGRSRLRL